MTNIYSMFSHRFFLWFGCLGLTLLIGCGQPKPVGITGTVTFKNEPIDKGVIQFVPADGQGAEGGGIIVAGKFTAKVMPGEKIVRIQGAKVTGKEISHPFPDIEIEVDIEKPLTTSKHWENSTLRITVQKKNEPFQFDL